MHSSLQIKSSTSSSKVAWEKTHGNMLASTNGNTLRLWDVRGRTDLPLSIYINRETDLGKQGFGNIDFANTRSRRIYSIDFSPNRRNLVVTGNADSVVRVFHVDKKGQLANESGAPDAVIQVSSCRMTEC